MVLLDYQMPDVDGVAFLSEMRRDPAIKTTKCLVLSSIGDRQSSVDRLEVAAWLSKPVRQSQLYSAVAMVAGVSAGWTTAPAKSTTTAGRSANTQQFSARVMLVEDNAVNQQVASRLLQAFGLHAQIAANGLEAVQRLQAEHFDLVFMDCQMPIMDGYEATRQIREMERAESRERAPIIAMTANAMQGDRERCLEAGMDDYMAKPVKRETLAATLTRWLPNAVIVATPKSQPISAPQDGFDEAAFRQLCELFDDDVAEVIDAYLLDAPRQFDVMSSALVEGNHAVLDRAAHTLKSSSRSIGAIKVATLAEQLESLARARASIDEVSELTVKLKQAYAQVEPQLRSRSSGVQRKSA
jgi:two-component system, sensor histidine kinase and response regulator